ncbi:hypothetical protein lbkm_0884 [Lachnospiraceae bacterium KM106-2]|nr:hypothetical protein lbkm_0884 [Lachnospiraceae bacterium KM106-2]
MKRRYYIGVLVISMLLFAMVGCSVKVTKKTTRTNQAKQETILTTDSLITLLKKNNLTVNDFKSFKNQTKGSILTGIYFDLEWKQCNYQVEVHTNNDELDAVYVTRKSDDQEVTVYTKKQDERSLEPESLKDFITKNESKEDPIALKLPEGLARGKGKQQGYFLKEGKMPKIIKPELADPSWYAYGGVNEVEPDLLYFRDGKLTDKYLEGNHMLRLKESEKVTGCETQAILMEIQYDLYSVPELEKLKKKGHSISEEDSVSKVWYVVFGEEKATKDYEIYLNAKYYSKEDVIALARSANFSKNAFNSWY